MKQGFERRLERRFGQGLPTQGFFCRGGAEGNRTTGTNGNANLLDAVVLASQPDSAVQDGEGNALRAHDAFEAG
jgi:hypothetical protein